MTYPYRLRVAKTIQAAATILRSEPTCEMNSRRLLCLLYHADRECIGGSGQPITGSRLIVADSGPIPLDVLDMMRGIHSSYPQWAQFISQHSRESWLIADPGNGNMSRYTSRILSDISARYQDVGNKDLFELTMRLPEVAKYTHNYLPLTEISLRSILIAFDREHDHDYIVENEQYHRYVDAILHTRDDELPC